MLTNRGVGDHLFRGQRIQDESMVQKPSGYTCKHEIEESVNGELDNAYLELVTRSCLPPLLP